MVVVTNLKPAKMRDLMSYGMVSLLTTPALVAGSAVSCEWVGTDLLMMIA